MSTKTQRGIEIDNMKTEILTSLNNPNQLEKLYRHNKIAFKREFNLLYPDVKETISAQIWYERLNAEREDLSWGTNSELAFVIVASFIAGLIAKIPDFTAIEQDYFYPRNIAFVVFPLLIAYFAWKQETQTKKLVLVSVVLIMSIIYINILPNDIHSDTLILACIHLPLFLWAVLGFIFVGEKLNSSQRRLDFLRYNGDLIVMMSLILLAGALLTGITIGLFELIDLKIGELYFTYVGIWGLAASPIVGTYLIRTNPHLVHKVSPVIAKVFTPVVFITLVFYLGAVIYTGKDPYNDREFLLIFNVLLIGVMALILFSVAETTKNSDHKFGTILLFALSIVTIILNGIALSAIVFRISEWGITPNRLAVLGSNLLILTHLLLVSYRLFKTIQDRSKLDHVEHSIASFLPIYVIWTILVTFIFPILFNFT